MAATNPRRIAIDVANMTGIPSGVLIVVWCVPGAACAWRCAWPGRPWMLDRPRTHETACMWIPEMPRGALWH